MRRNVPEDQPLTSHYDLLGTVVHDLKTPIASIKSYADLISQSGELNMRQQRYLERIHTAVEKMTDLVNDLLDLVWIESGMEITKGPCNLLDVVRAQIRAHEGLAEERGVTLNLTHDDNLVPVQADERRLHQVLDNLISNSIKYNRQGGEVRIHVERRHDALQVTLQDKGIGIAPEDLPHIFDKFYRAPREEASQIEGSGLGLSIAKAIIERHGGSISVASELGQGSTFWFVLPLQ